ncbi:hypothetical protein GGQ88_001353 [Novosphingobium hassiacum]|uniref:Microcin J25-processing protein McjB C-terminal domain-containing protein n=1 Tax=Novosphingobium hassiacum TaxID=173676 RepID=A0A7W5ZXQ6_9SPHN|nr:hypothetical protein [Novosphingobium hassiacum]
MISTSQTWKLRGYVGVSVAALLVARGLVAFVPFVHWRATLGRLVPDAVSPQSMLSAAAPGMPLVDPGPHPSELRSTLARCVEHAADRLPGHYKCLPKAAALQWMLRAWRVPSKLVIAFHVTDRTGPDAYHAWVEVDGAMIIGQCDRTAYRPIMVFEQTRKPRSVL